MLGVFYGVWISLLCVPFVRVVITGILIVVSFGETSVKRC